MADPGNVTGRMEARPPGRFSRSREGHIVWSMSADEAEEVGLGICDAFGALDGAHKDGIALMQLAEEARAMSGGRDL